MNDNSLDDATLNAMLAQLPSIENLEKTVQQLSPVLISIKFEPENSIPTAAVCLQDAIGAIAEARYALREAITHKLGYITKVDQNDQMTAVFFTRFYADDVALRLYAAGEHLAEAIVAMLEIGRSDLAPFTKKRVSRQAIVGNYLLKEKGIHPITKALLGLVASSEWKKTIKYRGDWVHNQPPLVEGLGIVYKRGKRWTFSETENVYTLGFGGGDQPEYSLGELLQMFHKALIDFIATNNAVVQFYVELLGEAGVVPEY